MGEAPWYIGADPGVVLDFDGDDVSNIVGALALTELQVLASAPYTSWEAASFHRIESWLRGSE